MSDTDTDRLSARLAAVERALTDRQCDCAHESFAPPDRSAPGTRSAVDPRATDDDLREAVEALCEYVLATERASTPADEHTAAVRAALDSLDDSPSVDSDTQPSDTGPTNDTPREWLERVAAAVFG